MRGTPLAEGLHVCAFTPSPMGHATPVAVWQPRPGSPVPGLAPEPGLVLLAGAVRAWAAVRQSVDHRRGRVQRALTIFEPSSVLIRCKYSTYGTEWLTVTATRSWISTTRVFGLASVGHAARLRACSQTIDRSGHLPAVSRDGATRYARCLEALVTAYIARPRAGRGRSVSCGGISTRPTD